MASSNFWHSTSTKSTSIGGVKISIYFAKYTYFCYFTQPLLQDAYISLSILHIYSIKYSFFYIFLLFPHSLPLSLTYLKSPTPSHHQRSVHTHHQLTQPPSSTHPTTINNLSLHHQPTINDISHMWNQQMKSSKIPSTCKQHQILTGKPKQNS